MPASTRKPTKAECIQWLNYPQASIKKVPYELGARDPKSAWSTSYKECTKHIPSHFQDIKLQPLQILELVDKEAFRKPSFARILETTIEQITDITIFKKYLASCIIAYGILLSGQHELHLTNDNIKQDLYEFYNMIYTTYIEIHNPSEEEIDDTIDPSDFLKLNNIYFKDRLKRKPFTIPSKDNICIRELKTNLECASAFGSVDKQSILYPLAKAIKCYCALLRVNARIIDPTQMDAVTLRNAVQYQYMDKVTERDFEELANIIGYPLMYYHSGKFSIELRKDCQRDPLFYTNSILQQYKTIFQTEELFHQYLFSDIRQTEPIELDEEIIYPYKAPIKYEFYHITSENHRIEDPVEGPGPVINLYHDVARELFTGGLFVSKEKGIFDTERYIINPNKKYDYTVIGKLFRFLLRNRINIPFKLSRAYILKLFGLYSFNLNTKNIYEQLTLITIYILETDTNFKKVIMEIFNNPTKLNNPEFCINSGIFNYPAMMNDRNDIIKNDILIYNSNSNKYIYNLVEFLYKNAVVEYFGNKNSAAFFEGFNILDPIKYFNYYNCDESTHPRVCPIFPLPKLELYMSGTGLTMDNVRQVLIPIIQRRIRRSDTGLNNIYRLLIEVLKNETGYTSKYFQEAYDKKFEPPLPLTPEQYHLEFIRYLLKFWTGSTDISELYYYTINMETISNSLPTASTCAQELTIYKRYTDPKDLYEDLVLVIIQTNFASEFGLAGGKKMKNNNPNKNNNHGGKKEKARARSTGSARKQKA